MMNCSKCHREIEEDSSFCRFCGRKQGEALSHKRIKRANGTGSISHLQGRRRKPWVVRVYVDTQEGEHERITYGTYATRAEAELALEAANHRHGVSPLCRVSVAEAYALWSATHFATLSEKGRRSYEVAWRYLEPLGDMRLRELRTQVLQEVINRAAEQGRSYSSVSKIVLLASKLCRWGMQNDILEKNYADYLTVTAKRAAPKERFSDEELERLWQHYSSSKDMRIGVILLLCYTGLRLNEFLSMRKSDYYDGCLHGGSKTEKGKNRTVPVPDAVLPIVERLMATEGEYLYASATGAKCNADNFRKRIYYKALQEIGYDEEACKRRNPHTCRHTFASLCAKHGVDPKALQDIIGHTRIETTLNTYTHTDTEWLKEAVRRL